MSSSVAEKLSLEEFRPEQAQELVRLWRESFELGVGVREPHPFEDHVQFLLQKLAPANTIRVAFLNGRMVGFIAATPQSVSQLYVRAGYHGFGIGTRLIEWAKAQSEGSLWLYTFARNAGARAFYERHGFRIVARGFEPEWKLDDLRYEWSTGEEVR